MKMFVSAEKAAERYAICNRCPHLKFVTKNCMLCGCFMKLKTHIASSTCPDNPPRWRSEAGTQDTQAPL